MRSRIAKSLTIASLAAVLAACSSVPLDDQAGVGSGTTSAGTMGTTGQILDPFNPQSILAQQRSVYFDFDSYSVSEQYRGLVETHAGYLAKNPQQRVQVQGNTDERGGAEYNLALGQRRAQAVSEMFTLLGVSGSQIETISCGKERPKATGSSEADFSENRRADIEYQR